MRINAKTPEGKKVFIIQFFHTSYGTKAITIDGEGIIETHFIETLTVIDGQYLRRKEQK